MLDDLTVMHERDTQDALSAVEQQVHQLRGQIDVLRHRVTASSIIVCGIGAAQVATEMLCAWPGTSVPLEAVSGDLPVYVAAETLCVVTDFGDDTTATMRALADAEARGARVVVLTNSGTVPGDSRSNQHQVVTLPDMQTPRFNLLLIYKALLAIMSGAGLLATNADATTMLAEAETWLAEATTSWSRVIPTSRNAAKALAYEVIGKSAVICSGPLLAPAALSWKLGLNESAKHVAWTSTYPAASHGELIGWSQQPVDKPYTVIDLRSKLDQPWIRQQMELSERFLSGLRPSPEIIRVEGNTPLQQLLWATCLGSYVSVYAALLNGINPTPTDIRDKFSKRMESA